MAKCSVTLKEIDYAADLDAQATLNSIVIRLPSYMRTKWVDEANECRLRKEKPTFETLREFIGNRARALRSSHGKHYIQSLIAKRNSRMSEPNEDEMNNEEPTCETTTSLATQSTDEQESSDEIEECLYCQGDHTIDECSNYRNENLEDRTKYAKQNGMCFNCLVRGHMTRFCEEPMRCSKCSRKHHSLLHDDNYEHKPREDQANQSQKATTTNHCT